MAPLLHLTLKFCTLILSARHHISDKLWLRALILFTDAIPDRGHEVHNGEKLIWKPSDDWTAASRCQKVSISKFGQSSR